MFNLPPKNTNGYYLVFSCLGQYLSIQDYRYIHVDIFFVLLRNRMS